MCVCVCSYVCVRESVVMFFMGYPGAKARAVAARCHSDHTEAELQAIKERRERTGKGRQATQSEKKAFAAGAVVNKGPAAARAFHPRWQCTSSAGVSYHHRVMVCMMCVYLHVSVCSEVLGLPSP